MLEAAGDYWKPCFYLLEDAGFEMRPYQIRVVETANW